MVNKEKNSGLEDKLDLSRFTGRIGENYIILRSNAQGYSLHVYDPNFYGTVKHTKYYSDQNLDVMHIDKFLDRCTNSFWDYGDYFYKYCVRLSEQYKTYDKKNPTDKPDLEEGQKIFDSYLAKILKAKKKSAKKAIKQLR